MCLSNLRINAPQRISAHSPICKYPASSRIAIPAIARACAQVWSRATNLWKETETPRPASRRARSIANVTHRTEKADRIESRFRPLKTLINPTFFPSDSCKSATARRARLPLQIRCRPCRQPPCRFVTAKNGRAIDSGCPGRSRYLHLNFLYSQSLS
jgi:hypothetical protein